LPLSERARVEVYLPDILRPAYRDLATALEEEFTYTFGGCTTIRGLKGSYLSRSGRVIGDRINVLYTDTPMSFERNFRSIEGYADKLRAATAAALDEESILIVASKVYHST
jgi:hypothetical protein